MGQYLNISYHYPLKSSSSCLSDYQDDNLEKIFFLYSMLLFCKWIHVFAYIIMWLFCLQWGRDYCSSPAAKLVKVLSLFCSWLWSLYIFKCRGWGGGTYLQCCPTADLIFQPTPRRNSQQKCHSVLCRFLSAHLLDEQPHTNAWFCSHQYTQFQL